ncbi:MAG: hypothetical protein HYZ96_00895 [Candidatus Omnitrophica bacterium]|nr:hypothetical protein [Candidatus Omnitrophota bacterium]
MTGERALRRSPARSRLRYAFDDENRLVVRERRPLAERIQPVRIIEGTVTTDGGNRLVYRADTPAGVRDGSRPHPIRLDGTWALTPQHDLALTLHETGARDRHTLYLKGALVAAGAHSLTFALRRQDGRADASQAVTLSGRWQADARNRLTFLAQQADGSEDRLTLGGGWEVGPHHELQYRYRRRAVRGRGREEQVLAFAGAWELAAADRLVYRLEGSSDSAFEFRASLQRPSLNAREGRLIYQAGIGLSQGKTRQQRVILFGAWKLNRDLSVSFEVPYAEGRVHALRFEGTYALTSRDRLAVALWDSRGEPLGLTVTFSRELVPDAGLFVRLRRDERERSVIGGVRIRF